MSKIQPAKSMKSYAAVTTSSKKSEVAPSGSATKTGPASKLKVAKFIIKEKTPTDIWNEISKLPNKVNEGYGSYGQSRELPQIRFGQVLAARDKTGTYDRVIFTVGAYQIDVKQPWGGAVKVSIVLDGSTVSYQDADLDGVPDAGSIQGGHGEKKGPAALKAARAALNKLGVVI